MSVGNAGLQPQGADLSGLPDLNRERQISASANECGERMPEKMSQ